MRTIFLILLFAACAFTQAPAIEPGVSHDLAVWRAARYSDIRYKLDLTLEKMSPVLKGTIEIRVNVSPGTRDASPASPQNSDTATKNSPPYEGGVDAALGGRGGSLIILDWRKITGHEKDSTISNVSLNGQLMLLSAYAENHPVGETPPPLLRKEGNLVYSESNDHLIFGNGVVAGENVITLDFTSPILTSGSAITRYIDKEDGSEYIYSLFVPSDASTAFPVFDQPDLKAKFSLKVFTPEDWSAVSNESKAQFNSWASGDEFARMPKNLKLSEFRDTKPVSTYVFAFTAGPWERIGFGSVSTAGEGGGNPSGSAGAQHGADSTSRTLPTGRVSAYGAEFSLNTYVRKSQAAKFKPHAAEVFRLTREGIKYLETYFDYKFPWPKYDLVLIPEFPFGGMEHAGATFLRESSVIFPSEPAKGDYISRANLIFHETAHQWFGDTVTMRWFDDLWLKEGFAEFMAYKTLEKVMPDANAWKVFYERNKQAAYATDSTKGTTPIYQPIKNLSAAKSAYGNIVYRKAPSFLRQAEFYLGEDKFQTAVRAFLKKHEYANATWQDLVGEFEVASGKDLKSWGSVWVAQRGVPVYSGLEDVNDRIQTLPGEFTILQESSLGDDTHWDQKTILLTTYADGSKRNDALDFSKAKKVNLGYGTDLSLRKDVEFLFLNYGDYGYGIFLLDNKSRDYVLKNIQNEKDPFLRSMMWGALWDSVREAELDPKDYVELVIKNLPTESDETIASSILGRIGTAMNYYIDPMQKPAREQGRNTQRPAYALAHARASASDDLHVRLENVLLDRMQHAETPGLRVTFYRAFVTNASTAKGREVLKQMLAQSSGENHPVGETPTPLLRKEGSQIRSGIALRTKDKFDIVTRLIILGDVEAPKLLADLEKTETSDDAKRYAYAAHAAFATPENRAKFWNDFINNKDISESWIEAAIGPFNSIRHADLSQPYLERALAELPNLKRSRKIFFVNGWLGAFIGGQRDEQALAIVNIFLADNPNLDNDLRLKILENVDVIERAVKIRAKYWKN